jgi:hypothetical protein
MDFGGLILGIVSVSSYCPEPERERERERERGRAADGEDGIF